MSDVNRDPVRWERSMTQDKEGQYVAFHDYALLLDAHDAIRAQLSEAQADRDSWKRALEYAQIGRDDALERERELQARLADDVPRPSYWLNPENLLAINDESKRRGCRGSTYPKFSVPCLTWAELCEKRALLAAALQKKEGE